jgi:hypothetical protein
MEVVDAKLYERIEILLSKLEEKAVPLEDQLWDTAEVGRYLHRSPKIVREMLACQPSFPKAIRLPSKGQARPLYNAAEVVEWARRFYEKN